MEQLQAFVTVARVKSFSKAAKLLHLSQPAVSAQVATVERRFGVRLFDRYSHGVELTRAGHVVFDYAEKINDLVESMEREVSALEADSEIVIGASPTVGNYALPCTLWAFKQKYPACVLRLEIEATQAVQKKVLENVFDLGVIEGPAELAGLKAVPMQAERLVAVCAPGAWPGRESVSPEELAERGLLTHERGSGLREAIEACLNHVGIGFDRLKVAAEMSTTDAIKSAVESGFGAAILPVLAVQREVRRGLLKALSIEGLDLTMDIHLVYREDKPHSRSAGQFMRFLTRSVYC
ncbi:MAG: LysR substrate-binding domain-containing protein [Bacillota bacterium]